MTARNIAKELALRLLPDGILTRIKKVHYARILRRVSETDEPDLMVLRHLVQSGQCVADIGANIGVYTKYLSERVGPLGRVCSVEPIPLTFDILRSNVRKLALENVDLENCAISDMDGQVAMRVPKYDSGGENFYAARIEQVETTDALRSFVVPVTTVDSLFSKASAVHFIKCDVEGHELSCVRGALHTIERSKPAWLIEISGDMDEKDSRAYQTSRILTDNGYAAYWFDGTKLRARRPGTKSINFFFLTIMQVEGLRGKGFSVES
jgi:FkbM family methyltransferase